MQGVLPSWTMFAFERELPLLGIFVRRRNGYRIEGLQHERAEGRWLKRRPAILFRGPGSCIPSVNGRSASVAADHLIQRTIYLRPAHSILSQLLYSGWHVGVAAPAYQLQHAAELMYYGGDIAEMLLAFALVSVWHPVRGNAPQHPAARSTSRLC